MKKTLIVASIICVSIDLIASEAPQSRRLKQASADKLAELAERDHRMAEALMTERQKASSLPLTAVSERVRKSAASWIRVFVKPKWLPPEFETKFVPIKGMVLREASKKGKSSLPQWKGDYLVLDYEIAGIGFQILESGSSVSMRIDFPQETLTAGDSREFIQKQLSEFFAIADPARIVSKLRAEQAGPLTRFVRDEFPLRKTDGTPVEVSAWDWVNVTTDGKFMFVSIPEVEAGPYMPKSRIGLQERF